MPAIPEGISRPDGSGDEGTSGVARVGAVESRREVAASREPVDDGVPVRGVPGRAAGGANVIVGEEPASDRPLVEELPEPSDQPIRVVSKRPMAGATVAVRGDADPRDARENETESRDSTANFAEALRLRVEQLAYQARDAEERGSLLEAASLWSMAERIVDSNPEVAAAVAVQPDRELARISERQRLGRARQAELHTGAVGRASIRPDVTDLRDRGHSRSASSARQLAERPAEQRLMVDRGGPELAGPSAAGSAVNDQAAVPAQPVESETPARPVRTPAPETQVAQTGNARVIPWEEEFDPDRNPPATQPEVTRSIPDAPPARESSLSRTSPPSSGEQPVASRRPDTARTLSREEVTGRDVPPAVATRQPGPKPGVTSNGPVSAAGRSRSVKLAGSTESAAGGNVQSAGRARLTANAPTSQLASRNQGSTATSDDIPIDPRTGATRAQTSGPGRRRIDPLVASNLARAETLASEEAERIRAAEQSAEQSRRRRVEILPEPPQPDPAEVLRREAEIAERRQREEQERLAAEKRAADLAYKGPIIRSMSPAAVAAPAGDEIRPGQFPTTRSNTGAPVAVADVAPAKPAEVASTQAATPTTPAPAAPQPELPPAPAASVGPALALPPLEPSAAPPAAPPAAPATAPAAAAPAPTATPPTGGPSLGGPALAAPPADPAVPGAAPAATPPAPAPAEAPVDVTEAEEPVLTWRRFWVPLGGLVAGLLGLSGLMAWRFWERRHFRANRRTISITAGKRTVPGRPAVAGKVSPKEEARPQRKAA